MLKYLRMGSKRNKMIWWILTVVTVVTFLGGFVFLFGVGLDATQQARATGAVAVVDGTRISRQDYQQAVLEQRTQYREQYKVEPQGRDEEMVEVQAWRGLVNNALMTAAARRNDLRAYDPEVVLTLRTTPPAIVNTIDAFKTNGQFDANKYAQALKDPGLNWAPFEQLVREQLPVRKLQERWVASIKLSQPELRQAYQDRFERLALSWVRVPPVAADIPAPSDSDLKRVYARYQGELCGPAATRLEVLLVPKPISPSEVSTVREQARGMVQRARAGEDFAVLARTYSEGANAEQGGALGRWVSAADMGPALAGVIAPLGVGGVSEPQQEGNQFFVFRVDSISAEAPPRYKLSQIVLRVRSDPTEQEKLTEQLKAIRARARKAGLGTAAAERGMATQQTPYFDWNTGPQQLFTIPQAVEWGLTSPLKAVSGVFENDDAYAVAEVIGKRPAGPRPFDEVREELRARAQEEARIDRASEAAQGLAKELSAGKTLEQAAGAVGLPVDHSTPFTRLQPDPRLAGVPEVVGGAFGLSPGGVAGPLRARDGWYFLRVDQRFPPDEQSFEALKAQISSQLLQQKQQQLFLGWLAQLRDQAKVQDLRAELAP